MLETGPQSLDRDIILELQYSPPRGSILGNCCRAPVVRGIYIFDVPNSGIPPLRAVAAVSYNPSRPGRSRRSHASAISFASGKIDCQPTIAIGRVSLCPVSPAGTALAPECVPFRGTLRGQAVSLYPDLCEPDLLDLVSWSGPRRSSSATASCSRVVERSQLWVPRLLTPETLPGCHIVNFHEPNCIRPINMVYS